MPPFCIAQGDRAELVGINVVGLKRAGWARDRVAALRHAFKDLFSASATRLVALEQTAERFANNDDVNELLAFVREAKRGICPPRLVTPPADAMANVDLGDNGDG